MVKYIDAHCHCYEIPFNEIETYVNEKSLTIVCVSDDVESSIKTVELARSLDNIVPCIGIHPWSVEESRREDLDLIQGLVEENDVACLGEVGLDTRFVPESIERQRLYFNFFTDLAREYGLTLNIHAAGTWDEVLEVLVKKDIERAHIHWYTGPKNLLDKVLELGYTIGANPAWKIQRKHRSIIEEAPLNILLTESDAPYKYRGLEMSPLMVIDTINYISRIRQVPVDHVVHVIENNFKRIFSV